MAARWDVDDKLYVPVRVVSVTTDETGTTYEVKMSSKDKVINQFFEENELIETVEP